MSYLMELTTASSTFPATTVLASAVGIGFIAAVTIGSLAWYNSKRPTGWKDEERPGFIPKIDQ